MRQKFKATSAIRILFALPLIKATKFPFLTLEPSFFLIINFILSSINAKACLAIINLQQLRFDLKLIYHSQLYYY